MKRDKMIFWTTTAIIAVLMFTSASIFMFSASSEAAFQHFGLPHWFKLELSVAKFLGVAALIFPFVPARIKEFAYFGFGLTIVSADIAHLSSGDPIWYVPLHVFFFGVLVTSYIFFLKLHGQRQA